MPSDLLPTVDARRAEVIAASASVGRGARRPMTAFGRPAWQLYIAFAAVVIVLDQLAFSADLQRMAYPAFALVSFVAFAVGVRRNDPVRAAGLWLFGVGILGTVVGNAIAASYPLVFGRPTPFPSPADIAFIGSYLLWAAGLGIVVRGRRNPHDMGGWIDTAIAIVAFSLLEFVLLIYPYFSSPATPLLTRVVSAAYPVADLLLLSVLIRLLVSPGSKTASFRFFALGFMATFASDVVFGVHSLHSTDHLSVVDAGWMTAYAFAAAAALHPSVRTLAEPVTDSPTRLTKRRLLTLAILALVPAAIFAIGAVRPMPLGVAVAISASAALLFLLVILRMVGLVRTVDRTLDDLVVAQDARDGLLRSTLRASEEHRSTLAKDIHDGPLQRLTAVLYRTYALKTSLNGSTPKLDDVVLGIREGISHEITALRSMMTTLRPGALVERGLEASLADHVDDALGGSSATCVLDVALPRRYDEMLEVLIYRLAQEAIAMACGRAADAAAALTLREDGGAVALRLTYRVAATPPVADDELSLFGMEERVKMVGGAFVVEVGSDVATISASFPVPAAGEGPGAQDGGVAA